MAALVGRIALVTGASKGIGAGIAKELAASGASVVVNYATSRQDAERVVAEITATGGKALAMQGDVSQSGDIDRMFDAIAARFGRLDILVNNAAILSVASLQEMTEAEFHRHFGVNVLGVLLATRRATELFGPEGGSVVNIGSTSTELIGANTVLYAGTKGAVNVITKVLATELGPRNIRVNAVLPGLTDTEGAHAVGSMDEKFVKGMARRTALGRIGMPQDIALVVAFLASDEARWLTGQLITASGGQH